MAWSLETEGEGRSGVGLTIGSAESRLLLLRQCSETIDRESETFDGFL